MFLAALLTAPLSFQATDDWLIVRSEAKQIGTITWEQIGNGYLRGKKWRLVSADAAESSPAGSRLVVGTPRDNPAVRRLARELGIRFADGAIAWRGHRYGPGTGLAIATDDPDGQGRLALFTGADSAGVFNAFSVNFSPFQDGYVFTQHQKELARRALQGPAAWKLGNEQHEVVRLDKLFWSTLEDTRGMPPLDRALRMRRHLGGYDFVWQQAFDGSDLVSVFQSLIGFEGQLKGMYRTTTLDKVEGLLNSLTRIAESNLGPWAGPKPVFYTFVGFEDGTNAQSFGIDPATGRPRVLLNLTALHVHGQLRTATLHELVHTLQPDRTGDRLLDRAMHESVATFLSQDLDDGTETSAAMLWTAEKLAAARAQHSAIVAEFAKRKDGKQPADWADFMYLHAPLRAVKGAPDRCGYYVGLLACKAWRAKHPDAPARDILKLSADDLWALIAKG